jgi:hypothetical protein
MCPSSIGITPRTCLDRFTEIPAKVLFDGLRPPKQAALLDGRLAYRLGS